MTIKKEMYVILAKIMFLNVIALIAFFIYFDLDIKKLETKVLKNEINEIVKIVKNCDKCKSSFEVKNTNLKLGFNIKSNELIYVEKTKNGYLVIKKEYVFTGYFIKFFIIKLLALGLVFLINIYEIIKFIDRINEDIKVILEHMIEHLEKREYKPLKAKLHYFELEKIKEEINKTVDVVKEQKRELYNKFYYHQLTHLKNRNKLIDVMKRHSFSLAIFDIDNFSNFNAIYGFDIGDKILKMIIQRLKKYKLKMFHLDIDKFALVIEDRYLDNLRDFIKEIIEELEKPYVLDDIEVRVKFRVGISVEKENSLLKAELALNATKELKEDIVFYKDVKEHVNKYKDNLEWLKKLKWALENDRIIPVFQPIVDRNKNIVKYEALVRIKDENNKLISPYYFLEIAKKVRLYQFITKIMFERVLEEIEKKDVKISLNLSYEDVDKEEIRNYLLEKIKNFKKANYLTIEIVESEEITDESVILEFLKEVKKYGVEVFIDDFGSGYANFDYLLKLNADGVKIDGSLIKNILEDESDLIITETVLSFAKRVNLKTVAEFVENEEIFEKLKSLGVDYFQGYYFSKPLEEI